ncbi:MAG: hypothetical protein AVDCRST_MAG37-2568, partial [uncultured Rubrobacteraceae bacterium]
GRALVPSGQTSTLFLSARPRGFLLPCRANATLYHYRDQHVRRSLGRDEEEPDSLALPM